MRGRTLATALTASCSLIAGMGAAPATGAVSCNLAGTTLTITLSANGDSAHIVRSGSNIRLLTGATDVICNVTPTVTNTDVVVVDDSSGQDTDLRVDAGGGAFAPGATDEAGTTDEIELQANMGAGGDGLVLTGAPGVDFWRLGDTAAGDGVNLNAGSETSGVVPGRDFDLEYFGVDGRVQINGTTSGDAVDAGGGPEFVGPLTMPIEFFEELSSSADDIVIGTPGEDLFQPGAGNDRVSGGAGDDRYLEDFARAADDDVDGGAGDDSYEYTSPNAVALRVDLRLTSRQATGVLGNDALLGIEDVFAGDGDDVLIGTDDSNGIGAAGGDDFVQGLGGAQDALSGAAGVDTVSYGDAGGGVTVDLETVGPQATGGAGTDLLDSFERVIGGPFADTLFGTGADNRFDVRDGTGDQVTCRGGADTVLADVEGVDALADDCETRDFDVRPDTAITSGPPSLSNGAKPTFAFTSTKAGSTFECSLDGGAFTACSSPHTLDPVADGAHVFSVRARDVFGAVDLSPAASSFTVDTSVPAEPPVDTSVPAEPPVIPGATPTPRFGSATRVTLTLATKRIPAKGPVRVRVANANGFGVTGTLSGQTAGKVAVSRRKVVKLKATRLRVDARARVTVNLKLPSVLRRLLARKGSLSLRLTAKVKDPAANTRSVEKRVTPRLKGKRARSR